MIPGADLAPECSLLWFPGVWAGCLYCCCLSHALSDQPSLKSSQTGDEAECSHWLWQDLDQVIWVHFPDMFELMNFRAVAPGNTVQWPPFIPACSSCGYTLNQPMDWAFCPHPCPRLVPWFGLSLEHTVAPAGLRKRMGSCTGSRVMTDSPHICWKLDYTVSHHLYPKKLQFTYGNYCNCRS